jgi:hypothetical protein
MSKERYDEIIDEVYENYLKTHKNETFVMLDEMDLSKEDFIKRATKNYGFGFLFGITLNERELSLEERTGIQMKRKDYQSFYTKEELDNNIIPTKEITLEYNKEILKIMI